MLPLIRVQAGPPFTFFTVSLSFVLIHELARLVGTGVDCSCPLGENSDHFNSEAQLTSEGMLL